MYCWLRISILVAVPSASLPLSYTAPVPVASVPVGIPQYATNVSSIAQTPVVPQQQVCQPII